MFKGLRTKIESEQKGKAHNNQEHIQPVVSNELKQVDNYDLDKTVEELRKEILQLNHQIESVIRERDESNDQNAQLYQLIEKLRRDLENEREVNSTLSHKLSETESALREKSEVLDNLQSKPFASNISISEVNNPDFKSPESAEVLFKRVYNLHNQLSQNTRQLKIKQQNLIDIKKALQKEILSHSKTQEELCKLRNQLKQLEDQRDKLEDANLQNRPYGSLEVDSTLKLNTTSLLNDKVQSETHQMTPPDGGHEEIKSSITSTPQLDVISTHSRSSTSVDEFDKNDLQSNNSKEVNIEYLRNVLFRYMTTTDTETAQHLVKALSVIMNFTPEQSSAIKSAMNVKSLSWLRLK